jgi:hypothetical protein
VDDGLENARPGGDQGRSTSRATHAVTQSPAAFNYDAWAYARLEPWSTCKQAGAALLDCHTQKVGAEHDRAGIVLVHGPRAEGWGLKEKFDTLAEHRTSAAFTDLERLVLSYARR